MGASGELTSPAAVRGYLRLRMQDLGHETFFCVFLDAQNRVIAAEELFRGTLTQTSVYPREIVKHALIQQMREGTKILKPTISPALGLQPRQVDREP